MPKKSKYPKLRASVKRGKGGQVWRSWWYDNRGTGRPDIALGTDYSAALQKWAEIVTDGPRIAGTLEEAFGGWEARRYLRTVPLFVGRGPRPSPDFESPGRFAHSAATWERRRARPAQNAPSAPFMADSPAHFPPALGSTTHSDGATLNESRITAGRPACRPS